MDLSDSIDFLKGITGIIKEKEFFEQVERIHQSGLETIKADARARREKMSANITAIQKFDSEIELIEFQFERIKKAGMLSETGVSALDECLADLRKKRKSLVFEKQA